MKTYSNDKTGADAVNEEFYSNPAPYDTLVADIGKLLSANQSPNGWYKGKLPLCYRTLTATGREVPPPWPMGDKFTEWAWAGGRALVVEVHRPGTDTLAGNDSQITIMDLPTSSAGSAAAHCY
ncbi:hypothetical protein AAHS21_15690 [Mycobacterium sp. 050272]|uniref:hypothetical protein n=1 Tax=Mycobacterium sp. 050272 TaxID=3142488 RepID=UPI003184E9AE